MAKVGLGVGIDFDVTGLRKGMQQATGELEKLRGITNRIGGSIHAAMAMPMVSFLGSVMQAHAEARKIQADLMAPFSAKMMEAQISADIRKMQVGQRMVEAGMDEYAARRVTVDAEEEMMVGLMTEAPSTAAGRSITSFMTDPKKFMANIARAFEGNLQVESARMRELLSGNIAGAYGFGPMSEANEAAANLGATRNQAALAMASADTPTFEQLRMQLERQTYALLEIERNTKGNR